MLQITDTIPINEREIKLDFIRASDPGGQNVNKVATAVQLRFDVANASALPDEVRERLGRLRGREAHGAARVRIGDVEPREDRCGQ